jgi:hypothetical protein
MPVLSRLLLPCLAALLVATAAGAAEIVTYESCTDATGRTVAVEADQTLPVLVQTGSDGRQVLIRHNPALLPRLQPSTRLFFFAHECARHSLGGGGGEARARQADCIGLATLLQAGLLKPEDLPALQLDLSFTAEEWSLLPGPPRSFDLAACPARGVVKLPPAVAPGARQSQWNACVHACGDRLWHCGKGCSSEACASRCDEPYRQCVAACSE